MFQEMENSNKEIDLLIKRKLERNKKLELKRESEEKRKEELNKK